MPSEIKVYEHICGGCGKVFLQRPEEEPPKGFMGSVTEHPTKVEGTFFACKAACIRAAVLQAVSPDGELQ